VIWQKPGWPVSVDSSVWQRSGRPFEQRIEGETFLCPFSEKCRFNLQISRGFRSVSIVCLQVWFIDVGGGSAIFPRFAEMSSTGINGK